MTRDTRQLETRNNSVKFKSRRDNFLTNQQNDLKVLKILFNFTKWLGIIPFRLEANDSVRVSAKCISIVFAVLYIIFECTAYKFQIKYDLQQLVRKDDLFIPLKIVWVLSNLLFLVISVIKSNLMNLQNWKRFFLTLDELEMMMTKLNFQTTNAYLIGSQTVAIIIASILSHIYHITALVQVGKAHKILSYLGWGLSHFYMACTASIIHLLAKIVEKRYNHIHEMIRMKRDDALNVKKAFKICKKLHILLSESNEVFGVQLLLCVGITFIFIVTLTSYFITDPQDADASIEHISLLFALVYLVTLIMTIMACESLERSVEKFIKTCYDIHENVEDERSKEQLLTLAKYLKEWKPAFSAAGFFNVNQKTLSAFLWGVVQYQVIVVQFFLATTDMVTVKTKNF